MVSKQKSEANEQPDVKEVDEGVVIHPILADWKEAPSQLMIIEAQQQVLAQRDYPPHSVYWVDLENKKTHEIVSVPFYVMPDAEETHVQLRDVPPMILMEAMYDETGKPQPPSRKVQVGVRSRRYKWEPDHNDPHYKASMEEWRGARLLRLMRTIVREGVVTMPKPPLYELIRERGIENDEAAIAKIKPTEYCTVWDEFPDADEEQIRFRWISRMLPKSDDMNQFIEGVSSLGSPTQEGVDESEERFPSSD